MATAAGDSNDGGTPGPDVGPYDNFLTNENSRQAALDMGVMNLAMAANDSSLANRYMAARYAGLAFGGDRDYYDVLGYNRRPRAEDYFAKYLRNDIARTIVDAPAAATWREVPDVVDSADEGTDDEAATEFEKAVERLFDDYRLLHYLERLDKVAGIGEYGVLVLGVVEELGEDESEPSLDDPLEKGEFDELATDPDAFENVEDDLAYLATFSQVRVKDIETVTSPTDRRYGLPEFYQIEFSTEQSSRTERVHHSRIIHVAEDLLENEVYGRPRLEAVLNRLDDLEKVVGGSAEMYWQNAHRRIIANYTGDGEPQNADEMGEQVEELYHGLRGFGRFTNVELETLDADIADPSGVVDKLLELIAGETGIPKRILTGSERGELASTQDRATFYGRIQERREQFAEPMVLRPVLDRLIWLGILPEPQGDDGYDIEWPDLFELNELEQADLAKKKSEALATGTGNQPLQAADVAEVRENLMGWDPEVGAETSLDVTPEEREREDEDEQDVPPPPPGEDGEQDDEGDALSDVLEDLDEDAQDALAD